MAATIQDFIRAHGITAKAEGTDSNPHMDDNQRMDHWRVTLTRRQPRRQMTVYFSKGYGHNGKEPDAAEVLSCLAMDAATAENNGDFEGWAWELGYDADSRKAERTYKTIVRQSKALARFVASDEAYQELLFEIEKD